MQWIPFDEAVARFRLKKDLSTKEVRGLLRGAYNTSQVAGRGHFERLGQQLPSSYTASPEALFSPSYPLNAQRYIRAGDGFHYEIHDEPAEVELSSFNRWFSDLLGIASNSPIEADTPPATTVAAPKSRKGVGGRPTKHDYEGVLIELARLVYDGVLDPRNRSKALTCAEHWCAEKLPDGGPERRELKERVDRFCDALTEN